MKKLCTILPVMLFVGSVVFAQDPGMPGGSDLAFGQGNTAMGNRQAPQGEIIQTIWPGEKIDMHGVTIAWDKRGDDSTTIATVGKLKLSAGNQKVGWFIPETPEVINSITSVLINRVRFDIRLQSNSPTKKTQRIDIVGKPQTVEIKSGAPFSGWELAVSAVQPLQLDSIELGVEPEVSRSPDGSEVLTLYLKEADGKITRIPAVKKSIRTVGRYRIRVDGFHPDSQTVHLDISAEPDYSLRGIDTYTTTIVFSAGLTYAEAFENLGNDYGFQVEWTDDNSEEAHAVKRKVLAKNYISHGLVRTAIEKSFESSFNKDIVSPTLVRLSVTESAKAEARKLIEQETGAKRARAIFDELYTPTTRIYKTTLLSAEAAEKLIKKELNSYYLLPDDKLGGPFENVDLPGQYRVRVASFENTMNAQQIAESRESVMIADPDSKVLVVTAIPAKHERISKLLGEMDRLVTEGSTEADASTIQRYRVEMVLLQGGNAGDPVDGATTGTEAVYDAELPARYGIARDDLKMFGFDGAIELGRGLVTVLGEPSELGESRTRLTESYSGELAFKATRSPYVVLQVRLTRAATEGELIENNVFLEPGKPTVLGVTNMKQALILILRLHE